MTLQRRLGLTMWRLKAMLICCTPPHRVNVHVIIGAPVVVCVWPAVEENLHPPGSLVDALNGSHAHQTRVGSVLGLQPHADGKTWIRHCRSGRVARCVGATHARALATLQTQCIYNSTQSTPDKPPPCNPVPSQSGEKLLGTKVYYCTTC